MKTKIYFVFLIIFCIISSVIAAISQDYISLILCLGSTANASFMLGLLCNPSKEIIQCSPKKELE